MTRHSKLYQHLMNSKRWKELRLKKLQANPLCERHLKEGKVVAATCVHHIVEVESGRTPSQCETLCYSWTNLMSLCRECHAEIHREAGSHTKDNHQTREQQRLDQWIARLRGG
jgi:5-methylcytosine-specific restriction enzyme A